VAIWALLGFWVGGPLATLRASAFLPLGWILSSVHESDHDDDVRINAVQDGVRELFDKAATKVTVDDRIEFGMVLDLRDRIVNVGTETVAEPSATVLVERVRIQGVGTRFVT
jgi:hypothetical protein